MNFISKTINSKDLLTKDEELELFITLKKGSLKEANKAKNRLVVSNLKLVMWKAKEYRSSNLSFDDLVQEGALGLMKAIEKFDYKKGFRFSTYAVHWIKQSILKALDEQSRTIKLSSNQRETLNKINSLQKDNLQLFGEYLTNQELSEVLNIDIKVIQETLLLSKEPYSIDYTFGNDNYDASKNPLFSDKGDNLSYETVFEDDLKKIIINSLSDLSKQEQAILSMNFGFVKDQTEMSIEEIAKYFNIKEALVKDIVNKAILKLKKSKNINDLADYN